MGPRKGTGRTARAVALKLSVPFFILIFALGGGRISASDPAAEGIVTAWVKVNPLFLELDVLQARAANAPLVVEVRVHNMGEGRLRHLDVSLHLDGAPCIKLMGPPRHHRGVLAGGGMVSVSWRLEATPRSAGCEGIVIVAQATATDEDGDVLTSESGARVVSR